MLSSFPARAQQPAAPKRVLVLYWYNKDYPWNVRFDGAFQAALRTSQPARVEYFPEYLESNRFPGEKQSRLLRDYLRQKYADRPIDVVVANSDRSLQFLMEDRATLFPEAAVVFIAINHLSPAQLAAGPGATGILNLNGYVKTVDWALKVHPRTRHVYVISGTLEHDKKFEKLAQPQLRALESRVGITYLTDLPVHALIAKVKSLPKESIVLFVWQQSQNEAGSLLEAPDIFAAIAPSIQVPVYGLTPIIVRNGMGPVGGYIDSPERIGGRAAQIALRIANGTRAQDIPVMPSIAIPVFDWRQLRRWGISEDQLPADAIVIFREPTFWQLYKWRIVGAISLFVLQAILIAFLLLERRRRRLAMAALRTSEERFATAFRSNPQPMSLATLSDGRCLDVNDSFLEISGFDRQDIIGRTWTELGFSRSSGDPQCFLQQVAVEKRVRNVEMKFRTRNGALRDFLTSAELLELDGQPCVLIAASDITERKKLEDDLVTLTARLFRLQDEERRRIARELHDETGQELFALSMNLAKLHNSASDGERVQLMEDCEQLAEQSIRGIRTLSYLLHPPLLDHVGLVAAVQWYVGGFSKRSGIQVELLVDEIGRLDPERETALFRVVQEGLTNIHRHSGGANASIRLEHSDHHVTLEIKDDGQGMPAGAVSESPAKIDELGVGIPGMRERLRQLGGRLEVASSATGTIVTATVPTMESSSAN